jgi:hypothetical protein
LIETSDEKFCEALRERPRSEAKGNPCAYGRSMASQGSKSFTVTAVRYGRALAVIK